MSEYAIANLLQNARDGVTKAIMVVDYTHHEIHAGSAYYVEGSATLSDTEQLSVKFSTPNSTKRCHFVWEILGTGETEIKLYEDAKGGMAGGSAITVLNHDRESTKSSSMAFRSGVTTSTAVGAKLHDWIVGTVGSKQGFATPAMSERGDELILKAGSTYLGIMVSNSTGNNISFRADWYEHAPYPGPKVVS
jgi:hypothetical protein